MVAESSVYSMVSGRDAKYIVGQDGKVTVSINSTLPMKFRGVYVGSASVQFRWVSTGKSTTWQFTPTLQDPKPAQFTTSTADDGEGQIVSVEFGDRIFPAAGLVNPSVTGAIAAPGIHFDLPHAYDLWVFLLRSPWFPLKLGVEKTLLTVTHGFARGTAHLNNSIDQDEGESLRADLTTVGEGFSRVWLSLRRSLAGFSIDETIGENKTGMDQFTWKPALRSLNLLLVTPSNASLTSFLGFLQFLGADAKTSSFSFLRKCLLNDFILCDGPAMDYTLSLVGEKHIIGHERDESKISLKT